MLHRMQVAERIELGRAQHAVIGGLFTTAFAAFNLGAALTMPH